MADTVALKTGSEPWGAKPRRALSGRNIMLYGTLAVAALYYLLPLYVMLVTSFKPMEEIRLGALFALPQNFTVEPWISAWTQACTGLECHGIRVGFWNSVKIVVPRFGSLLCGINGLLLIVVCLPVILMLLTL